MKIFLRKIIRPYLLKKELAEKKAANILKPYLINNLINTYATLKGGRLTVY